MPDNIVAEQIFFPLRQADSASQVDARNLLASPVYQSLHQIIRDRLADAVCSASGNGHRHSAVLVDGARGTGKSSVLTNLAVYLRSKDKELLGQVHILKPIDPTLLEDNDDLFLNIVVAAVLSDKIVKDALAQDSDARTTLYKRLHHLGHALENMQTQRDKKGVDKIRAFIGNQELVEEIHTFFGAVLNLIGKKLLILPIDDVDASLHRAFENLEVVRRYLTSPLILPMISGDASLYHDVTWRDFHGRLLRDSKSDRLAAQKTAHELATEYHRKVLPLQYRLRMPDMRDYFNQPHISLGNLAGNRLTFPHFHAWLEVLLNDRSNSFENSYLPVPIRTVRAFSQLVYRVADLIPALEQAIAANQLSKSDLRHYFLMPDLPASAIQGFKATYQSTVVTGDEKTRRNSRDAAYADFTRSYGTLDPQASGASPLSAISTDKWIDALEQHFLYDAEAGAAYLVLKSYRDWRESGRNDTWLSVFDTPLFQPQLQASEYPEFKAEMELSDWGSRLKEKAPESWLKQLPKVAILPYPVPEIGSTVSAQMMKEYAAEEAPLNQRLLAELLLHRNFYQSSKTSVLLCVGRIFEIVITSLLRDVSAADLGSIMTRPPFYSLGALAQTKTLISGAIGGEDVPDDIAPVELEDEIAQLAEAINVWRRQLRLGSLRLSPWLVYNVMNKVFNQASVFNILDKHGSASDQISRVARKAFNSIWAAFGSFEKGQLYGLPPIIASVNIGDGNDFQNSDLYRQNITPFVGETSLASQFGLRVGAITTMLEKHPLKLLCDQLPRLPIQARTSTAKIRVSANATPTVIRATRPLRSEWLYEHTGKKQFEAAARRMLVLSDEKVASLLAEYRDIFKDTRLNAALRRVVGK